MINKISYLLIIIGFLGFLTLIPGVTDISGVTDDSIYYYYRIINGKIIKFDNNCYSIPDGWFKTTKDIDNSGYSLLRKDQVKYEIILISKVNKDFFNRIQSSALLKQVDNDSYSIYKVPSSSTNNGARYWLVNSNDNLVIEGSTVSEVKLFSEGLRLSDC